MTFREKLLALMEERKLSKYRLADVAGLEQQAVYSLFRKGGSGGTRWYTVQKLATALGVTTDSLRDDAEEKGATDAA